jgi:dTDP-4-amino-4,6-dideoxygalactose transaminase
MYDIGQAEIDAVAKVIRSGKLFRYAKQGGTWCERFERQLAERIGVRYALTTTSGTASLICALAGVGVGPGDEVIVPAYTFIASALAVLAVGAVPVVAEIDETLTLDPKDAARRITRRTRAIMPVHMAGRVCNLTALGRLARRNRLVLIEDACQAVGGSYRGRRLGAIGRVGAFSFNYFKNITCGEGGAVLTSDREVFERAMIQHDGGCAFWTPDGQFRTPIFAGGNFRISEIQGAILLVQLRRLDRILARLRKRREAMREALAGCTRFQISPDNDPAGDCGSTLPLLFESERAALGFQDAHRGGTPGMFRPIDTGRHVYTNWEALMQRRGSFHPRLDPLRTGRRVRYSRDTCRRSLQIMARTVCIHVPYKATVAEARRMARQLTTSLSE